MKSLNDLNYRLPWITAALYALGGWGVRYIRRWGVGLSIAIMAFLYYGFKKWWHILVYLSIWALMWLVTTLPFTAIGDSIQGHWFNWMWIWIKGSLAGGALFPLCLLIKDNFKKTFKKKLPIWIGGIFICSASVGISMTLSNMSWGNWLIHPIVEGLYGFAIGFVAAKLIGQETDYL